jgi:hypothetical protein
VFGSVAAKQVLTGDNYSRHFYRAQQTFEAVVLIAALSYVYKRKSSPVTGLEWLREFQEVKLPRFHDNSTGWW